MLTYNYRVSQKTWILVEMSITSLLAFEFTDQIFSQREIKKITFKGFIKDPGFYFFDTAHYIFLANFLLILLYSYEYFQ